MGAKRQKKRIQETPRKPRTPKRYVVGSSSTLKQEELDRFKVQVRVDPVDAKGCLTPGKWFEFGALKQYQSSILSARWSLTGSAGPFDVCSTRRSIEQRRSRH